MTQLITSVIGGDPGATAGLAFLDYVDGRLAGKALIQVDADSAVIVLEAMLAQYYSDPERVLPGRRFAGIEDFIPGKGAGSRCKPGNVTRQLQFEIVETLQRWGYYVQIRSAGVVKPWATDTRLTAAGIAGASSFHGKARDTYDAARHGLYAARWDAHLPDPLR